MITMIMMIMIITMIMMLMMTDMMSISNLLGLVAMIKVVSVFLFTTIWLWPSSVSVFADHMESLMYYLGEVVNSGVDDSRFLAMELLFFLSCFIYCMEYYSQHVAASHLQAMRHRH